MAVPSPTTSALLPQVVNENLFQSLSGALKDPNEHVTLFRHIDGGNIGRVLPKYLSQWTTEKIETDHVVAVVGWDANTDLAVASGLEIYSILVVIESMLSLKHDQTSDRLAEENNTGNETWMNNRVHCHQVHSSSYYQYAIGLDRSLVYRCLLGMTDTKAPRRRLYYTTTTFAPTGYYTEAHNYYTTKAAEYYTAANAAPS
ncbi:hypothetical protein DAPPUDRAFT_254132 [Daphnia pulex]|uniref:Uncharacterized protein n=1 Tax=Daphnia pulex TaxID=6669 RepID=E9H6C6_DAPPU|nr:hypothetical protein DAPPUDRAFT_254132 [Daphnia pulex]|eukprot:EFX72634.1 hypothetical protein DAPPUDRAFT_254132 [Daphnia pulex]